MAIFSAAQLLEIAKGLESSGQEFIWGVREKTKDERSIDWLPDGFESRIQGRGLIIKGWAPQVLILEHEAVGGFITHCGWNSVLEGVAAGVPMVTWPLSAEQFFNEKLVTEILKMGTPVGAQEWTKRTDDHGEPIKGDDIQKAVMKLMVGEEGERMRIRAGEFGDMAKRAVEKGGSSDADLKSLMEEIRNYHHP
ncbi:UNVERIFIED_CONTAM: Anthocyanin 3'-O-beta-glucosyltransferase [Sesamum radiatum]|uniref:Anthocyanin 3'-O-beta-glucosyltransferase n=1 Tax=Sesamum radiatum TaxID=300843 RepID=A0AAW2MVN8_SESRA